MDEQEPNNHGIKRLRELRQVVGGVVCVATLLGPPLAAADEPPVPDLAASILQHDTDLERRIVGLTRVRLSYPQQVSGALGAMVVRQPASYDCTTVCDYRGWLFQVEPGLHGGQISARWKFLRWSTVGR